VDCLYKESIDRIQFYLEEYLIETYNLRKATRIEGGLSNDELETLLSSSDESKDNYRTSLEFWNCFLNDVYRLRLS
jgi:hypothetical protein